MPPAAALVLPFEAISATDLGRVGGKGANLGELAGAGFPVPPGFVVTAEAFRRFVAGCGQMPALYDALDGLAPDNLAAARAVGQRVRAALAATAVPDDVAAAIRAAWRAVGADLAYAVRSSATAEDLPGASFAGQQDTFLNVRGEAALLAAVRDCWVSLFTDRAIVYRARQGFGHRSVRLAAVVQRMVAADVSGILFTADPVTGHRHHAVIEAGFGLGEALVGGLITADRFRVDTRTGALLERTIAHKDLAIRPLPGGGTAREPLAGPAAEAPALTGEQARALAALGARVAAHFGAPQDIEWAIEAGRVYLLQARPITTLFPLPAPEPEDGALHVYLSFGHLQVMPEAMPPMALSVFPTVFPAGQQPDGHSPYFRTAAGRLYIDPTALLAHAPFRYLLPRVLRQGDVQIAAAIEAVVDRSAFRARARLAEGQVPLPSLARSFLPVFGNVFAWLAWRDPDEARGRLEALLEGRLTTVQSGIAAAAPSAERLAAAARGLGGQLAWFFPRVIPFIAAGIASHALVERLAAGHADPADVKALGRGLAGNVTTGMDLAVGDLADVARAHPAVAQHLAASDPATALVGLGDVPGGAAFLAAWDAFLTRYGMRGPSEIDVSRPRWRDDPRPLVQVVVGNLGAAPGAHRERHERLMVEAEAAAARVVRAVRKGPLGPLRARAVARLIRVERRLLALREHPKFLIIRLLGLFRDALLEAAAQLVAGGSLERVDDVWFLTIREALAATAHGTDRRSLVARRRAEFERDRHLAPPRVLTSEGEVPNVALRRSGLPPGALSGTPASGGVVEGVARVVLDPAREVLQHGEILVAPFTDPGWTPLFINAAGLVMEVGGLMTHGSVVAREYGIPAVVGVPDATRLLHTGQRLRVDGDGGYVVVVDGAEPERGPARASSAEPSAAR